MNILIYAVPVAVILAIILTMVPIMKKQASAATTAMTGMKDSKLHIFMPAGNLVSINGTDQSSFQQINNIFGVDLEGPLSLVFTPNFMYHKTHYTSHEPMTISFEAKAGKSYEVSIEDQEPKNDPTVLDVRPVVSKELIFKNKFYIITKDITDTKNAKGMRGIY